MTTRLRATVVAGVVAVVAAVVAVPQALASPERGEGPGSVVSAERVTVPLLPAASATRILYRSLDTEDRPTTVSGIVLTPVLPRPGPARLVGFAAGTQGLADRCAPSRQLQAGTEYEAPAVASLLTAGYTVAVTDYEGLGTPGEHTYVNRAAQAHALLDVLRAAPQAGVGIPADSPAALYGYSQGGGASAAAAELAPEYAPELDLVGAYAGAVPADLRATGRFLDGGPYVALLGYAVSGFDAAYPDLGVPQLLNERGRRVVDELRGQCTQDSVVRYPGLRSEQLSADGRPISAFLDEEPFASRVDEQLIGRRTPEVPVLMAHSVADDIVPFEQGRELARRWCAQGADVEFRPGVAPTHVGGYPEGQARALPFLEARFAGLPTASTCG
ncbi:lipase family protein [Pseudonocardia spirodelae]|uniref:Lipase family protein n=1 Tax=Pseudonocardia spirodelae TaxID=3133431 RepID=A0ABU8TD38_9PSEU